MISVITTAIMTALSAVQAESFALPSPTSIPFFADADGDAYPELVILSPNALSVTWLGGAVVSRSLELPDGLWAVDPGPGPGDRSSEPGVYCLRANRLEWLALEPLEDDEPVVVLELTSPLPLAHTMAAPFPLVRAGTDGPTYLVPEPSGVAEYGADGTRMETEREASSVQWITTSFESGLRGDTWPRRTGAQVAVQFDLTTAPANDRIPPRWGTPEQWSSAPAETPERWPWFYLGRDAEAPGRAYFRVTGANEPRTMVRVQPGGLESPEESDTIQEYPGYPLAAPDFPAPDVDGDGDTELFLWRGRRALAPGAAAARVWREGVWTVYLEMRAFDPERGRFSGSPVWRCSEEVPMPWLLHTERSGPVRHLAMPDWNGDGRTDLGYAIAPTEYVVWTSSTAGETLGDRQSILLESPIERIGAAPVLESGATMLLLLTENHAVVLRQAAPSL